MILKIPNYPGMLKFIREVDSHGKASLRDNISIVSMSELDKAFEKTDKKKYLSQNIRKVLKNIVAFRRNATPQVVILNEWLVVRLSNKNPFYTTVDCFVKKPLQFQIKQISADSLYLYHRFQSIPLPLSFFKKKF